MWKRFHVKYLLFSSDFNETNFLDRLSKENQISNLIKILSVGAELFLAENRMTEGRTREQTDMKKLIVLFEILRMRPKTG